MPRRTTPRKTPLSQEDQILALQRKDGLSYTAAIARLSALPDQSGPTGSDDPSPDAFGDTAELAEMALKIQRGHAQRQTLPEVALTLYRQHAVRWFDALELAARHWPDGESVARATLHPSNPVSRGIRLLGQE